MKKVKVIKSIILIAAIMLGTLSVGDVNSVNAETASPTDASPTNAKWLSNEVESDDDLLDYFDYREESGKIYLIKFKEDRTAGKINIPSQINGEQVVLCAEIFKGAKVDEITIDGVRFEDHDSCKHMFESSIVKKVSFTNVNFDEVDNMSFMFHKCRLLESVDFGVDRFFNVNNTEGMFTGTRIKSIEMLLLADKVYSIRGMFAQCSELEYVKLKLIYADTWSVLMSDLFSGCSNLKTIDFSEFLVEKIRTNDGWLERCSSLEELTIMGPGDGPAPDFYLPHIFVTPSGNNVLCVPRKQGKETLKALDKDFKGFLKVQDGWYDVKDRNICTDKNGTFSIDIDGTKAWRVVENGKVLTDYKGFAQVGSSVMYFENGLINKSANGTYYGEVDGKKSWYVVKSGKVDKTYTGFAKVGNSVMYYNNGVIDKTFTGTKNANVDGVKQWYYVKNGKINKDYTGFAQVGSSIMYFINGSIDKQFTGLVSGSINGVRGTYYVQNGKYKSDFNGTKSFVIKNGKLVEVK